MPLKAPWSDCKVAFDVADVEDVAADLCRCARRGKRLRYALPRGWELVETDETGARCVVVFRVDGVPRREDGDKVRGILDRIEARRAALGAR